MNPIARRTLQIGGAIATLVLGTLLATQSRGHPLAMTYVLALVGVSLIGMGISGFESPAPIRARSATYAADLEKAQQEHDRMIDLALQHFIKLIKDYVILNVKYHRDLSGLNDQLLQLPSRDEVQDIVVKLMNTNIAMQIQVTNLSKQLEESQLQIVSLQSNIAEVGKIALLDSLTELGNRRSFDQSLQKEIARARDTGAKLCMAMADIDRFKSVNDRFGHVVGDHLLKLFAGLLKANLRSADLAARYGGEEFALLFPGAGLDDAASVAEKIRREIESKRWVVGQNEERLGAITASFGVAQYVTGEAPESFVQRADAKLFEAKSAGRNRVAIDDPDDVSARAVKANGAALTG